MGPRAFPAEPLARLASRVVRGEVVFFIGSGFSIDSEGNTAARLMSRLLIRLLAFTEVLGRARAAAAREVLDDLGRTFGVSTAPRADGGFPVSAADVSTLSARYYETNDWFCVAYGKLLELLGRRRRWPDVLAAVRRREEEIRVRGRGDGAPLDAVPLDAIDPSLVRWASARRRGNPRLAGKALFLDTMGFRHREVMTGEPGAVDPVGVLESYRGRLLPRHDVLARLAREGFCTTTLTANFDTLLEGAFRVAGFRLAPRPADEPAPAWPTTYFDELARIASPTEFFAQGKAHRSAVLVKIHGCVGEYRSIPPDDRERLTAYLRSMVFTYREIQNWREDSWAADYLRTLLRTRTVVFCGYSLQDPVIHDTFRTVYEDMARQLRRPEQPAPAEVAGESAPAFFLAPDSAGRREFHGMEVLHAATRAVGATPDQFNSHPNYLRFHFRSQPQFPRLDELLQWLFHDVFRQRQRECLDVDLRRTAAALLGRPRPDAELEAVRARFHELCAWEQAQAAAWDEGGRSRREHAAVCGWTGQFHTTLLREFGAAELVHARRGPSRELSQLRRLPWHYPTTAAGGWACWGAVVELALRSMIAAGAGGAPGARRTPLAVRAAESAEPTVLFSPAAAGAQGARGDTLAAPVALTIRLAAFERLETSARVVGAPVRRVSWELTANALPWPAAPARDDDAPPAALADGATGRHRRLPAPDARRVWRWAAGLEDDALRRELPHWLGLTEDGR